MSTVEPNMLTDSLLRMNIRYVFEQDLQLEKNEFHYIKQM